MILIYFVTVSHVKQSVCFWISSGSSVIRRIFKKWQKFIPTRTVTTSKMFDKSSANFDTITLKPVSMFCKKIKDAFFHLFENLVIKERHVSSRLRIMWSKRFNFVLYAIQTLLVKIMYVTMERSSQIQARSRTSAKLISVDAGQSNQANVSLMMNLRK